jgi:transcriptional regulator with XRE-family HTH domain
MTGAELKARRERLGLSQTALANLLGTTQNTISRWELGTLQIEKSQMLELALEALEKRGTRNTKRRA